MNVYLLEEPGTPAGPLVADLAAQAVPVRVFQSVADLAAALDSAGSVLVVLPNGTARDVRLLAGHCKARRLAARVVAHPGPRQDPDELLAAGASDLLGVVTAREIVTRRAVAQRSATSAGDSVLLENANDTIYTVSLDGFFLSANAEAEELTGYPRSQLIGMHLSNLVVPEHLEIVQANIRAKLLNEAQSSMFEVDIVRADGRRVPIEISSRLLHDDGRVAAIEGIARDLTHRRQLEAEVAFRAQLLEMANAAAYAGDREGRIIYWNRGAERLFGLPSEQALGQNVLELLVPREHWRRSAADFGELLSGRSVEQEFELQKADGSRFIAFVTNTPVNDASGRLVAVVAVCLDLTERKRQEDELATLASERSQLAHIVESAHDAIISRDNQDRVVTWNQGAENLFGYSADEIVGTDGFLIVPPAGRDHFRELLARARRGDTVTDRTVRIRRDGLAVPVQLSSYALRDFDGSVMGTATILRDVSAQHAAEVALAERERMLTAIFESTIEAIWLMDADLRFVVANRVAHERARKLFGRDPQPGDSMQLYVIPENWQGFQANHASAMRGTPVRIESRTLDADRNPVYMEFDFNPVRSEAGEVTGVVLTSRDITARKRAERARREAEQSLHALVDHAPILLFGLDLEGRLTSLEGTHAEKSRASELLGKSWFDGYGHVEERRRLLDHALAGEVAWDEITEYGVDWEIRLAPRRDTQGRIVGAIGVATDVTDRNRIEAERRRLDADYRTVMENTSDGLFAIDVAPFDGPERFTLGMMNPAFAEFTALDPARVIGRPVVKLLRGAVLERALARYEEAIAHAGPITYEELVPGETPRYSIVTLNPLFDEAGRCYRLIGSTREITERRRLEAAQRELDANYRAVVESTTDAVFIMERRPGEHFRIVSVNDGYGALVGLSDSDLHGRTLDQMVSADMAAELRSQLKKAIESHASVEFEFETRWNHVDVCLAVTLTPIFDENGFCYRIVTAGRDITERRRHERERRAAQEAIFRLGNIIESTSDAVISADMDGAITFCNDAAVRMYGYSREELVGQPISVLYLEDNLQNVLASWERIRSGETFHRANARRRRKDGSLIDVEISGFPVRDLDGNIVGTASVAVDVTERVRAENALREKAADLDATFASAAEGIILIDRELRVLSFNQAAAHLLQSVHGGQLAAGDRAIDWVLEHDREAFLNTTSRTIAGRTFTFEQEVRPPGQPTAWWEFSFAPVKLENGEVRGVAIGIRDVSDRKQTEETLRQAQKLESLAVLAGGIAHDFNNLLVGILGNAGLALAELSPASPARETIEAIETAGQRAAELARQMLAYSGKGKFVIQSVNMNELVEEMAHLLRVSTAPGASLAFHLYPALPVVEGDATQLRQVIMNLVVNASDAIGDREGTIAISTSVVNATSELLRETYLAPDLPAGSYISIEVRDTGAGMSPETVSRIFDPFFTTKFTGRGLGLAAVLGIMRGHRGAIKVESEEGLGTTFTLLLPAASTAATPVDAGPPQAAWRGSGTVLVIDDEPTVRAVTARALRAFGFDVIEAGDGVEGLERYAENRDRVVAALIDMTMPRMNGIETLRRIRELNPGVALIMMSGYSEQDTMAEVGADPRSGFVQKPFELAALRETLRGFLDQSS